MTRSAVALLVLLLAFSGSCAAAEQTITHLAQWLLFEMIEDGVVGNKRAAMDIYASQNASGKTWAEARVAIFTIDRTKKRVEVDPYYCSTDQATITNLRVSEDTVSFDMTPFPLAPDRPLHVVVTREGTVSGYRVSGAGVWPNLITKGSVTVQLKQVPSFELPYTTIGR